jgi:predicted TIM-barrel fold metal-dependent hydrolase
MVDNGAYIEYTLAAYGHSGGTRKTDYYVEIEYASDPIPSNYPKTSIKTIAEHVQELGEDNCILATDYGVYTLPPPVEGLREFIALMLDLGVSEDNIIKMIRTNPEKLLGLPPV